MKRIVLIGVGTENRGDDAIGLRILREIRQEQFPNVDFRESRGDGARLLTLWAGYERVIIVDAIRSSSPPGTVHRIDLSTRPLPYGFECTSSHRFGVNEAVETARALGELPQELVLIGVELGMVRVGVDPLFDPVVKERVLAYVYAEIARLSSVAADGPN